MTASLRVTSHDAGAGGATVVTAGRWIGHGERAAFGWLSAARGVATGSGVLVLPPVGYAWWSSYQTLRLVSERLARLGHTVVRLQYHGTGNAAGSQSEPDRLLAWRASVQQAADELSGLGCDQLTVVGVQVGGSLALEMAREIGADAVAAWAPVIKGRREARTLRLRSHAIPDGYPGAGGVSFGGTVFGPELLAAIADIDLLTLPSGPGRALIIDDETAAPLVGRLEELEVLTEHRVLDDEQTLGVAAEDAVPALQTIEAITDWIGPAYQPSTTGDIRPRPAIEFAWQDTRIREEVVTLGAHRLVGILTSPARAACQPGTVVVLNSGSEPHVGPGRAWVELARDLAVAGSRVLRVDFRGWGESPDDGYAPGRPYDQHCIEDTIDILTTLRRRQQGPIVLVGLCAGAWIALKATLAEPADAVVAINPQLYWQPGDPVEALLTDTRKRRTAERLEEEAGRESGRWDALDRAGHRNAPGAWLDQLAASETRLFLLSAEGDDGLEYLENRLALRLADLIENHGLHVETIPGIDHAMHRTWLRPAMFAAVARAVTATRDHTRGEP